ncbi:hypothetical protein Tco_0316432 [Tanacetum coccineum]
MIGIDFCLVDCLEGCGIGGGIKDGADVGRVEGGGDLVGYEQCPNLACHNVFEVEVAKVVGNIGVVVAADDVVGVDVGVGYRAYSPPNRDPWVIEPS